MKNPIKRIIASIKRRRDERFRERIDRVYFRHDGDGVRYIEGCLAVVRDTKHNQDGMVSSGAYLTYEDAISTKRCSGLQAESGKGFYSESYHSQRGGKIEVDAIKTFKDKLADAYPDGARFLSKIKEIDCGDTKLPVFRFDANIFTEGFLSAKGICERFAIAAEVLNALEERSHIVDISRVRIDGCHEAGDFVLKLRFGYRAVADKI